MTPDEKDSSLHTTYSWAKRLQAAAAVESGIRSLVNHSELQALLELFWVYTCCCDRYRAGPTRQKKKKKRINKKKMLWLNLSESAWRKQEGVEHHASGSSHHQNGSIDKNKKTLAGGAHTFIQCPTISRYKAEGDEVLQRCSGTETNVSPSEMAGRIPLSDGCRGMSCSRRGAAGRCAVQRGHRCWPI